MWAAPGVVGQDQASPVSDVVVGVAQGELGSRLLGVFSVAAFVLAMLIVLAVLCVLMKKYS